MSLGRIFWKVLLFTLLAQLLTAMGIGAAIGMKNDADFHRPATRIGQGPAEADMVAAAAATLRYGGKEALRALLSGSDMAVYAIDAGNVDVLDRSLTPALAAAARALPASGRPRQAVQQVLSGDGQTYLLFSLDALHAAARPAFPGLPGPRSSPDFHEPMPPPHNDLMPLVPFASALFCSLLFSTMIAWYFSKPIRNLRTAFEAVANGNLDLQVASGMGRRKDELADLGRDFDRMAERLRALLGSQRNLMHDVSHELRSPLARMQVAVGLARQQPQKVAAALDRIEQESERMDRLVDELLTLSRLDAGVFVHVQEDIFMDELVADIAANARFEADSLGKLFVFRGDCPVRVQGDPELLHRALENILRNGLKHTAAGTAVTLACENDSAAGYLKLSITDHGPGVHEAELPNIFQPFFRGSNTRQQSTGHGLGLAIAERIITAMGGSIAASNRTEGGFCVLIALPLCG